MIDTDGGGMLWGLCLFLHINYPQSNARVRIRIEFRLSGNSAPWRRDDSSMTWEVLGAQFLQSRAVFPESEWAHQEQGACHCPVPQHD